MTPDTAAYKKSSFGPAFLFLDKRRREALAAYYAFCRLMDDIADEPGIENRLQELAVWQKEVEQIFTQQAATALGKKLQQVVADFGLSKERFLELIEAMQADIQGRQYKTFEELEWYLWRVAGTVGVATLDILGIKGAKAFTLARALGFAVQTTNIVRDVHEDAAMGRVYLPQDSLEKYGLTQQAVLQNSRGTDLTGPLAQLAEKSKQFYAQAAEIMNTLPARKMIPCRVMGFVYLQNLAKIEKTELKFKKAVKLTKSEKIKYALYALCKAPIF